MSTEKKVDQSYFKYWQIYIFTVTFCNYAILHAQRACWSLASANNHISTRGLTAVNTTFLFAYAVGGLWAGALADMISKRKYIFYCYTIIGLTGIGLGVQQYWVKNGKDGLVGFSITM